MKLMLIGLGKICGNMARRLLRAGHTVIGFDNNRAAAELLATEEGLIIANNIEDGVAELVSPKVIWVMVPSGKPTEETIQQAAGLLKPGDIVIDGGNSNFNDSIRLGKGLAEKGIHFFDAGVSGDVWGLKEGYSIMVGGDKTVFPVIEPLIKSLAPGEDKGWGLVGPIGSGHFTKMVHNGIEYGKMEAFAEGFELLQTSEDFNLDVHQISKICQHSTVVRSSLHDLIELALTDDKELNRIKPWVYGSGKGRWKVIEANNQDVPVPVITSSLFRRFESREDNSYAFSLLCVMRNQFGGYEMKMEQ